MILRGESMRWLDEQGMFFGKIHWLDLVLILTSFIVFAKIVFSLWPLKLVNSYVPVQIEIFVSNLPERMIDSAQPGQWVKDAQTGIYLGKIVKKRVVAHEEKHIRGNKIVLVPSPDRKDLTLTLQREAVVKENQGIYLGRKPVRAGQTGVFQTLLAEFNGQIMAVKVQKGNPSP